MNELERGMETLQRLSEIMPDEAEERTRRVYEDIQQTLRVPFVNFLFRALANYRDFLEPAWSELAPSLRTLPFERASDELRAAAVPEAVPPPPEEGWEDLGELGAIGPFTETIHYVLPKLLLVATCWHESFVDAGPEEAIVSEAPASSPSMPRGVAAGTRRVSMLNPEDAPAEIRELFRRIRERHAHPGVASYYRALGHWPAFLKAIWERVEPWIDSSEYTSRREQLLASAKNAAELTAGIAVSRMRARWKASLNDDRRRELSSVLAVFRFKLTVELLLDVSMVRAMLHGIAPARESRYSYFLR